MVLAEALAILFARESWMCQHSAAYAAHCSLYYDNAHYRQQQTALTLAYVTFIAALKFCFKTSVTMKFVDDDDDDDDYCVIAQPHRSASAPPMLPISYCRRFCFGGND